LGLPLFIIYTYIYINYFPLSINTISDTIIFADYASVLIYNRNFCEFINTFNMVILHITTWFHAKQLILNVDKMIIVKFTPSHQLCSPLTKVYDGKLLTEVLYFKVLSLQFEKHLYWRSQIAKLLPKLNTVCYTIRNLYSLLNTEVLRIVYFVNFQFLLEYGIIFWGNSSQIGCIFLIQKRINRTMVGVTSRY